MLTSSPHGDQLINTASSERYFSYSFPQLGLIRARHPVSQTCDAKFKKKSHFLWTEVARTEYGRTTW